MDGSGQKAQQADTPTRTIAALCNVTKKYGAVEAAKNLNLNIQAGEFLSFLGPSGCGKTTALRMLAGFETPSEGDVQIDGAVVNGLPPHRRPVNMVFQQYALFPHLTVAQNIGYGLKQRRPRPGRDEIAQKVTQALETVRLSGFEDRRIWEMSGGQQQRVALARAIVNQPKMLLLDEPMAALDRKLRKEMQIELQTLQRKLGITFILVTHDQEEALSMSDRIAIMKAGKIVQIGSPQDLYDRPCSRYVADFVGTSNFFDAQLLSQEGDDFAARLDDGTLVIGRPTTPLSSDQPVYLSVRPEQIALSRTQSGSDVTVSATVKSRIFLGEHTEYLVNNDRLGDFLVLAPRQAELNEGPFDSGDQLFASWKADAALILQK